MIKYLSIFVVSIGLFSIACKSESKEVTQETATVDTIQAETPKVPSIDTASIVSKHQKSQAAKPAQNQNTHQSVSGKLAKVDSDPVIAHHEAPAEETSGLSDENGFYLFPTKWAEYPGGEKALDAYLEKHLRYPAQALDNDIEGTVYVNLFIDENGALSQMDFISPYIGYGLESEVSRVLQEMPVWIPGEHDGIPVKSKFTLPVIFNIQ